MIMQRKKYGIIINGKMFSAGIGSLMVTKITARYVNSETNLEVPESSKICTVYLE